MLKGCHSRSDVSPFWVTLLLQQNILTISKSTHFFGQPVYGQLIKCLDKDKIIEMSSKYGGEADNWQWHEVGKSIKKRQNMLIKAKNNVADGNALAKNCYISSQI